MRTALLLLPLLFVAACGRSPVCHLPMIPTPGMFLDASAWLAAHPGDALTACLDDRCATVNQTSPAQLQLPAGTDSSKPLHLTVTDASGLHASRDFAPVLHTIDNGCGEFHWYETPGTLTAAGRLQPG